MSKINRPMSPHLTIYKPQLTAVLSIFHRITGTFLSIVAYAFLFLNGFFDLHLHNYSIYNIAYFLNFSSHWFLLSLLFLILLSIYYHFINGIRHLLWDTGRALEIKNVYLSGYAMLLISFFATIGTWMLLI
ncbi:MAG: succinate dehydrogenase, cytochrome b556 subunit [Rhodospirillaceae bacterium]|nr:MAG: succinate dehydrogenase, cytochrome b556 subunit [Rhodospirillaceae bacterium]